MGGPTARRGGFAGAWQHHRWRRLLTGTGLSGAADSLYVVPVVVYVLGRTGSATWVAAVALVRVAAAAVLGPIGGALADRADRRRLLVALDVGRAAVMGALALVAWAEGPVPVIVVLVAAASVVTVPYRPATVVALPAVVAEDDLAAANAAHGVVGELACFVGPALGGAAAAVAGPGAGLSVSGAAFAIAALLLASTRDLGAGRRRDAGDEGGVISDVIDGLRIVRRSPTLLVLTSLTSAVVFQMGVEQVVHVLVAQERLGIGASGVGAMAAAVGVGGLVAAPFSARLGSSRYSGLMLAASGVALGLPLALLAVLSDEVPALAVLTVAGVGGIVFEVLYVTLLQRSCPEHALARVYGLQDSLTSLAQFAGVILAPVLVHSLDLRSTLLLTGLLVVGVSLALAPGLHSSALKADVERQRLAPLTDRFRELGIFGAATTAALERLARSTERVTVPAGTVVFREGDPPDRLYVIVYGTLSVHVAGAGVVNRMTENEWFGEIGLIRGVARTATVTADTDAELLAIPGQLFLDVITGMGAMADPLRATATRRLAHTHPHLLTADDD